MPTNFEEIFKASQETLNQFLITELPINIFLVSTEGYICWANTNLLNLVNVNSLQEVIGIHISHWDECRWDAIQEVIRTKQETIVEEFYNETFFSTVRKPVIQNNKLIGVLGLSINITGKKQAERAKQQFMMNMAHDLRTPLAGIIGIASIQANQNKCLDDQQQYGRWIMEAGNQLLELLNAVMDVMALEEREDALNHDRIELSHLMKELTDLMQPSIVAKGLHSEWQFDPKLPAITSDVMKLKRILLNLISNAIKFTEKGTVRVAIHLLGINDKHARIEIQIKDTGIGIPSDQHEKIFDQFYRAHPSYRGVYSGYGVGLYLVKKAVDLLGGKIAVSSEEGKGSCFTLAFNFPLAEEDAKEIGKPMDFFGGTKVY
ncbi:sensory box histidine kinase/response regulator [Rickettsiella grylli]|uniref:histidine kinase n=2 Tax=Rickettsiella grylli TaxID=59196 RepID=A8PPN1_9COXI|nr:sensory box histidine kinase/response regulator [Rickettsiella grylli]